MLNTKPNFARPDDSYARLIAVHDGLSENESQALNARLILLLMNHIGDAQIIAEAIDAARLAGTRSNST